MQKFMIKNLGEPFDGLIVYVVEEEAVGDYQEDEIVPISRIQSDHVLFSSFSLPLEAESLFVKAACLVPYEERKDDQLTDNPFGKYICDGKFGKFDFTIHWGKYAKAFTVKIMQGETTLYMHNFFDKKATYVKPRLDRIVDDPDYDWDSVVFDVQELE